MNLGGRIIQRLNELKWERRDLLDRVPDLTSQALHNLIKRDSKRSEWDTRIAEALGVSTQWLVYGDEEKYTQAGAPSTLSAGERTAEVFTFNVPKHPAVEEVLKLMTATDDLGKGMMLVQVRNIAKERMAATNKPASTI